MPTPRPKVGQLPRYDHRLCRDLILWIPFNEGCGNKVHDVSKFQEQLEFTDYTTVADWTFQKGRQAPECRNRNGYIYANRPIYDMNKLTMSCWVRITHFNTHRFLCAGRAASTSHQRNLGSNGTNFQTQASTGNSVTSSTSLYDVDSEWTHVVATFDGNSNIWVNGFLESSTATAGQTGTLDRFAIKRSADSTPFGAIDGQISDCRAWNRVLSSDEILELYTDPYAPFSTKRHFFVSETPAASSSSDVVTVHRGCGKFGPRRGQLPDYSHPLLRGCIGWWPLNDNGGETARDLSLLRGHGVLNAMAPSTDWVIGEKGVALDFNGTDDRVNLPDGLQAEYIATNQLSCGAWVRNRDFTSDGGVIGHYSGGGNGSTFILRFDTGSADGYEFTIVDNSNTPHLCGTGVASGTQDVWQFVFATWDGKTSRIYVDGIEVASLAVDVTIDNSTAGGPAIGSLTNTSDFGTFDGLISNAMLYSRALSPSEVWQLYKDPWAPFRKSKLISFGTSAAEETSATNITVRESCSKFGPKLGQRPDYDHPHMDRCVLWIPFTEYTRGVGAHDVSLSNRVLVPNKTTNGSIEASVRCKSFFENTLDNDFYLELDKDIEVPAGSDLTMSLWFKWTNDVGSNPGFWRDGAGTGGEFFIYRSSNGYPWIRIGGNSTLSPTSGAFVLDDGEWHHNVYMVKSGEWSAFYQDGIRRYFSTHTDTMPATIIRRLLDQSNVEQPKGYFQDIRFWTRTLDDNEVWDIYRNPWAPFNKKRHISFGAASSGGGTITEIVSPVKATFSVPAVTTTITHNASAVSASLSTAAAGTELEQAPASISATLSVPSVTTSLSNSPDPITAALSVVAPSTSLEITPAPLTATMGVPSVSVGGEISIDPVSATFAVPEPTTQITVTPASVVANWSVPDVGVPITVEVAPVVATWVVPQVTASGVLDIVNPGIQLRMADNRQHLRMPDQRVHLSMKATD